MIDIKNISKWYGSFQVLTDCTTTINKGDVVVVCGPSGSGKSTLIKTVNALEPIQKGDIVVDGTSISDPKTNLPKLRSRVGMVFQHFELFPHLSITDNLTLAQIKVLLPLPEGPQTTTTSPFWMDVVQSVSTWKLPYHLETLLMSITTAAPHRMIWIFFCSRRTIIDRLKQMTK